jgi:hypothetical protein
MRTSTGHALRGGRHRRDEGAFHPAGERDGEKEAERPGDGDGAALLAQDVEEKDERGEHRKAHELLHALHPGAGFREPTHPRRLRRKEEVGRAHSCGDRKEHEEDDAVRLRERKADRGAEHRRGAGCAEHSREDALKK